MAFANLREFIAHLEKHGWLRRVSAPVSRDLEIAEITDRVSKSAGGRNVALLFETGGVAKMAMSPGFRQSSNDGGRPMIGSGISLARRSPWPYSWPSTRAASRGVYCRTEGRNWLRHGCRLLS